MDPITIRYAFRPVRRSLATGQVADLFGLAADEPPYTVADGVELDARPGDLVLVTGPSGSGKSSLLREVGRRLGAVDALSLELPDVPLIDALAGPVEERLGLLAACGLSEARVVLRTPGELSDGQRYRFRLAVALGARNDERDSGWVMADEFAANLDRTLAKVIAFNLRKLVTRTGVGALLATTHEDLTADCGRTCTCGVWGMGTSARCATTGPASRGPSRSPASCGSKAARRPTGTISPDGTTAATGSRSSSASCCSNTPRSRLACACSPPRPRPWRCGRGTSG